MLSCKHQCSGDQSSAFLDTCGYYGYKIVSASCNRSSGGGRPFPALLSLTYRVRQTAFCISIKGTAVKGLYSFFSEGKDQNQKTIMFCTSYKSLSMIVAIALVLSCTIPQLQGRSLDDGLDGQAARSMSLSVKQEGTYTLCLTCHSVFVKFVFVPDSYVHPPKCINGFARKLNLAAIFYRRSEVVPCAEKCRVQSSAVCKMATKVTLASDRTRLSGGENRLRMRLINPRSFPQYSTCVFIHIRRVRALTFGSDPFVPTLQLFFAKRLYC